MNLNKNNLLVISFMVLIIFVYNFSNTNSDVENKTSEKVSENIVSLVENNKYDDAYTLLDNNKTTINNFNYLIDFIEKKEKVYIKEEFNKNALLSAFYNMKSLKINRAIDSTTFFSDGELLEVSKKLSIDLINYYGVDRRTAYRIFSMYMVGLFGDENNISNYVTINDGDAIRNDNALNADDNCTIDKYGKSCIANTSDTYKPFFLKKELKNNNKHTDFLFETSLPYTFKNRRSPVSKGDNVGRLH